MHHGRWHCGRQISATSGPNSVPGSGPSRSQPHRRLQSWNHARQDSETRRPRLPDVQTGLAAHDLACHVSQNAMQHDQASSFCLARSSSGWRDYTATCNHAVSPTNLHQCGRYCESKRAHRSLVPRCGKHEGWDAVPSTGTTARTDLWSQLRTGRTLRKDYVVGILHFGGRQCCLKWFRRIETAHWHVCPTSRWALPRVAVVDLSDHMD